MTGIGDIDQDGVPDLVIGNPAFSTFNRYPGSVFLYSGRTGDNIPGPSMDGEHDLSLFGVTVAATTDLDGDGLADFFVGASNYTTTEADSLGKVYAFSSATRLPIWTRVGPQPHNALGGHIAVVGDASGDGVPDLVVGSGAPLAFPEGTADAAVLSGADGSVVRLLRAKPGVNGLDTLHAVADYDGDGCTDVVGMRDFRSEAYLLSARTGLPLALFKHAYAVVSTGAGPTARLAVGPGYFEVVAGPVPILDCLGFVPTAVVEVLPPASFTPSAGLAAAIADDGLLDAGSYVWFLRRRAGLMP
ncbi:MAG: integrin alpha [Candidatus Methylomirabilis sp.]|nr:integrin alpha [Deltaproteobacteria bacterium]